MYTFEYRKADFNKIPNVEEFIRIFRMASVGHRIQYVERMPMFVRATIPFLGFILKARKGNPARFIISNDLTAINNYYSNGDENDVVVVG
jgi:hypothetical protein